MRVLEREPAHRGAAHVHVEDPAAALGGGQELVVREGRLREADQLRVGAVGARGTRPCPSRSRAPRTGGSSGSPPRAARAGSRRARRRRSRIRGTCGEILPGRTAAAGRLSPPNGTGGEMVEPRRIWWARPRKLCALERPGGGGRSHRPERRAAEIDYLKDRGVRLVVSVMRTRHNLAAYEAAGLEWRHVPVAAPGDGPAALEELLALLRRELRKRGAVAVHGDRRTEFVSALCAAHLHEARGAGPGGGAGGGGRGGSRGRARRRASSWASSPPSCERAAQRRMSAASVSATATGCGSAPAASVVGLAAGHHQRRVQLGARRRRPGRSPRGRPPRASCPRRAGRARSAAAAGSACPRSRPCSRSPPRPRRAARRCRATCRRAAGRWGRARWR